MPRRRASQRSAAGRSEIPALELECIKVLWEAGDLTVHAVRERLFPRRPLAYTTVMTVLDRLARKGAVSRRKMGRAHVYHAVYSRESARDHALERLVENYFSGSLESLLDHLSSPSPIPHPPTPNSQARVALDEALL